MPSRKELRLCSARKNVLKLKLKPNDEKQLKLLVSIFVILQVFNYLMREVAYTLFTYIFIITSCLFCMLLSDGSKSYRYTQIALIATVGADFFLVFLPFQLKVPGVLCFCVTQFSYFMRIWSEDENGIRKKVHLILRVAISVFGLIITILVLGIRLDVLSLISVLYYANLILNLIFSYLQFNKMRILAIALSLFIVSDTLLGFDNLSSYLLIPRGSVIYLITRVGGGFVMPLYLAAHILIPLSLFSRKRKALMKATA